VLAPGRASAAVERAAGGDAPSTTELVRPGLAPLAARAGQAISSYVRPSAPEVARASSDAVRVPAGSDRGAAPPSLRELVRTGGAAARSGGGEPEIPPWFEEAAREMFRQRSGGVSESISIAELTLIATAPARSIAADARDAAPSMAAGAAPTGQSGAAQGEKPNIDKIAAEVYAEVLNLLELARSRSGDPWS
jgi:hypothetical protein